MEPTLGFLQADSALAVFLAVFAKRMGVPVPALPFLLLAGARGADDGLFVLAAMVAGCLASVMADTLWFGAGRHFGPVVLAWTCRISITPGSCIQRSERLFERHGAVAILFSKFVPGVAGLAPPFAGALGMASLHFLVLNAAGTVLWIGAGLALGLVFHRQVGLALQWLDALGSAALPLLAAALAVYLAGLVLHRRRSARSEES